MNRYPFTTQEAALFIVELVNYSIQMLDAVQIDFRPTGDGFFITVHSEECNFRVTFDGEGVTMYTQDFSSPPAQAFMGLLLYHLGSMTHLPLALH